MKKRTVCILVLLSILLVAAPSVMAALTLQVSPASVRVNNSVTITVDATAVIQYQYQNMTVTVDFGDGSSSFVRTYSSAGPHNEVISHTYSSGGNFTVTATSLTNHWAPNPDYVETRTRSVTVTDDVATPPTGYVGENYQHNLGKTGSARQYSYRLIGGSLPPGVTMTGNGVLSGVPSQKGSFPLLLRVTMTNGTSYTRSLHMNIEPGTLGISVKPHSFDIRETAGSRQQVTFQVTRPTVTLQETISSSRGEFLVNGIVIGAVNTPMNIALSSSIKQASESIAIPQNVVQSARQTGQGRVTYRRLFSSPNFKQGGGQAVAQLRTAAQGNLRIISMRVYFKQNNRSAIIVNRNERNLTGAIDVQFNGSGVLKGYWRVDDRILQRVQRNLLYGNVITLETPATPPLPTFSEGGHRLSFVVTEPVAIENEEEIPVAMYYVEALESRPLSPITLVLPADKSTISGLDAVFTWTDDVVADSYRVEFFTSDADKPFFSALGVKKEYRIPEKILGLKFATRQSYRWRVSGFDRDGELVAQSDESLFVLSEDAKYVSNEVVFLVDSLQSAQEYIQNIAVEYAITVKETAKLASIERVLAVCSVTGDIDEIITKLQGEDGIYNVQRNFIFKTQANGDPLRTMQKLDALLDFDLLHGFSTGKDVRIAIIDTGVDIDHRDLKKNISEHENLIRDSSYQAEIHGTAVAGLIAGEKNDFGIVGLAPDAALFTYRACRQLNKQHPEGECRGDSLAKAVDRAIMQQVDIVNLSIGCEDEDKVLALLIGEGHERGMLFVAPVGNDTKADKVAFPAADERVIGVAGFDERNSPLPNEGVLKMADAVAPAQNVFSTIPDDGHNFFEGTSFSAATVSGILALSREKKQSAPLQLLPHIETAGEWKQKVYHYLGIDQ